MPDFVRNNVRLCEVAGGPEALVQLAEEREIEIHLVIRRAIEGTGRGRRRSACLILVTIGLVWRELRLTERQRSIAQVAGFLSAYLGLAGNVFSAIVDLPGPASHPGVTPPMPEAAVFFTLLAVILPATLIAFGLVMYGMRGEPTPSVS